MDVKTRQTGFSLLEIMVVIVVVALLASFAMPMYEQQILRARTAQAIGDIGLISLEIQRFRSRNNNRVPMDLAELSMDVPDDPWGRPYSFLNIVDAGPGKGALRKDGKLNPLNTDYDLFSSGKDGDSKGPLNAKASRDDIVRANDGAFIGLAEDY